MAGDRQQPQPRGYFRPKGVEVLEEHQLHPVFRLGVVAQELPAIAVDVEAPLIYPEGDSLGRFVTGQGGHGQNPKSHSGRPSPPFPRHPRAGRGKLLGGVAPRSRDARGGSDEATHRLDRRARLEAFVPDRERAEGFHGRAEEGLPNHDTRQTNRLNAKLKSLGST